MYGGIWRLPIFNDPTASLTIQTVPDYFYVINSERSPFGDVSAECNNVIEGVTGSDSFRRQRKKGTITGQALFSCMALLSVGENVWWCFPLQTIQNPVIGDGNGENLTIPRSSTKGL